MEKTAKIARAQKEAAAAFDKPDKIARGDRLEEINETFTRYSTDFGRKLFLIQNSIFGADIQPVACQIAKLRFFISLAIEQTPNLSADNLGIKPLPNLETRFVIADTLTKIGAAKSGKLASKNTTATERQLSENRERHFNATVRQQKIDCRKEDKRLRKDLAEYLQTDGFGNDDAQKIADWDPYDQNKSADWFSAEYMFGIRDGFDIVIGNPPYVQLQADGGRLGKKYETKNFNSFARTGDIYMLFYEQGLNLCRQNGILMFITSNTWMRYNAGKNLRKLLSTYNPSLLINMGGNVFENVSVSTNILMTKNEDNENRLMAADYVRENFVFPPTDDSLIHITPKDNYVVISQTEQRVVNRIESVGIQLKDWDIEMLRGLTVGYNDAFVIDDNTRKYLIHESKENKQFIKPMLRGRNISRYFGEQNQWIIVIPQGWTNAHRGKMAAEKFMHTNYPAIYEHINSFADLKSKGKGLYKRDDQGDYYWELRACAYYSKFEKEKLAWGDISMEGGFCYNDNDYILGPANFMSGKNLKFLLAVLNSHLIGWYMPNIAAMIGDALQWKKTYVEKLPIPKISDAEQRPFINLVDKIIAAKKSNSTADTSEWENEIDQKVYKLYGLTEEEIKIVEGK